MQEAEILQEVILDGSAREKNPFGGLQVTQRSVRQVLTVLEAMALITYDQPHLAAVQDGGVEPECLVGYYQDGCGSSFAVLAHKRREFLVYFILGARVYGEGVNTPT